MLPWQRVQISCNPLPWASGKIQSLSLNWLWHDHMLYFACSPWKWVVTTTCQVLVVWLRIHLLPFYQQSTPEWLFTLCISSLLKGAARNRVSQVYSWRTAKSTDLKWKKCSHVCLLTFLLKRGGGLGRVSVPLRVGWSVPELKSSQSVSSTVRCLVWWSWGNFVQSLELGFLNSYSCCLSHSHKVYCFDICTPMVERLSCIAV